MPRQQDDMLKSSSSYSVQGGACVVTFRHSRIVIHRFGRSVSYYTRRAHLWFRFKQQSIHRRTKRPRWSCGIIVLKRCIVCYSMPYCTSSWLNSLSHCSSLITMIFRAIASTLSRTTTTTNLPSLQRMLLHHKSIYMDEIITSPSAINLSG